jgi:myo-inositol-1(or 4)-monophosphatase
MDNKRYLKVAVLAARQVAPIFVKFFGQAGKVEKKDGNPRDLVTQIDRKIETQIRKIIAKNFPEHKIIGEEFNKDEVNSADLVWIIDPIDGTTNFIHGIPIACISIALWNCNEPLAAVVYNPISGQMLTAVKGGGAFLNNRKIFVSQQKDLLMAFGGFGWGRDLEKAAEEFPKMVKKFNKIRTLGSTAWEICLIAMGGFDFLIQYRSKVWDFAAAMLILQEAGGIITDVAGKPIGLQSNSVIASNKELHKIILNKIF